MYGQPLFLARLKKARAFLVAPHEFAPSKSQGGAFRSHRNKNFTSHFTRLESAVAEHLCAIRQQRILLDAASRRSGAVVAETQDAEAIVAMRSKIREELWQVEEKLGELEALFLAERGGMRSKLSPEELDAHEKALFRLRTDVEQERSKSVRINLDERMGVQGNSLANRHERPTTPNDESKIATRTTAEQQSKLVQIQHQDDNLDRKLDELGGLLEDLQEVAQMQKEEVKRQNKMLENTRNQFDDLDGNVRGVNARMRKILGRL